MKINAVLNKSTKSASVMPFGVGCNNNQESISRDEFSKELSNTAQNMYFINPATTEEINRKFGHYSEDRISESVKKVSICLFRVEKPRRF